MINTAGRKMWIADQGDDASAGLVLQGNRTSGNENCADICITDGGRIWMRMTVKGAKDVSFAYSLDGVKFALAGPDTEASPSQWVGAKCGIYAVCGAGSEGGSALFEYFEYSPV